MTKVIEVNKLGKRYLRRELGANRYQTLRDTLFQRTGKSKSREEEDHFWALRHADLEVEQGEILGVIGPNGAGKSTLLKLLSRVTAPTEGSFTLRGRVASLLEVGTGFHPELTGRENIFLSGTVMGMKRREIKACFDEIVDFAGVEKFLDLPVKRYSSGMYVRLGFAIAAHLQAEILLVDEVLAVGDAAFQKKCLGKIGEVAESGRTVLFVSHNLGAIGQLCDKSILISKGEIQMKTSTFEVIEKYHNNKVQLSELSNMNRKGIGFFFLKDISVYSFRDNEVVQPAHGESLVISLSYSSDLYIDPLSVRVDLRIDSVTGTRLIWLSTLSKTDKVYINKSRVNFVLDFCPLNLGDYTITVCSYYKGEVNDWIDNCHQFSVNHIDYNTYVEVPKNQSSFVLDYKIEQ